MSFSYKVLLVCLLLSHGVALKLASHAAWSTPQEAKERCEAHTWRIGQGEGIKISSTDAQAEVVNSGDFLKAQQAMVEFDDVAVKVACSRMFAAAAQWNEQNTWIFGVAGIVDTIVAAARDLPKEAQYWVLNNVPAMSDYSVENRARFREVGGLDLAFQFPKENAHDCDLQGNFMCMVSVNNYPPENLQRMLDLGVIPIIVQAMKNCPNAPTARGEAIWDVKLMLDAFPNNASLKSELVDVGFIQQLAEALRGERTMHGRNSSYDPLGTDGSTLGLLRMSTSAMRVLDQLVGDKANHCKIVQDSGAVEQIREMLLSYGDLQGVAPWGDQFSLVDQACPTLQTLARTCGEGASIATLREDLRRLIGAGGPSQRCASFLTQT